MRKLSTILAFLIIPVLYGVSGVIVIEGEYQNRNIYVQNPISGIGVGYCTYEVIINGSVSTDEINSTSFEIDLKQFNLEPGTPVTIKIKYKDNGCAPKVLNPDALIPNPTFETVAIDVNKDGLLQWTTLGETSVLPFIIEQFKWNKWVRVGEVQGTGKPGRNTYFYKTTSISGVNKFRVKQKGYYGKTKYTPSVSYTSLTPEITYIYIKKNQNLEFSVESSYEVYDKYGNIVKKGFGNSIDLYNLKKDVYYMNYGNTMAEFRKK